MRRRLLVVSYWLLVAPGLFFALSRLDYAPVVLTWPLAVVVGAIPYFVVRSRCFDVRFDAPLFTVADAPTGTPVKLVGTIRKAEELLASRAQGKDCVYYRVHQIVATEFDDPNSFTETKSTSFWLEDATGRLLVAPVTNPVFTERYRTIRIRIALHSADGHVVSLERSRGRRAHGLSQRAHAPCHACSRLRAHRHHGSSRRDAPPAPLPCLAEAVVEIALPEITRVREK